jgi:hypothetical protein
MTQGRIMRWKESWRRTLAAAGLAGLAACSSQSGAGPNPSDRFDPAKVADGVATVDRVSNTPAMASFRLVGRHLGDLAGAPSSAALAISSEDRLVTAIGRIAATVFPGGRVQAVPVLRSSLLGKTFVYDPAAKKYVVDPARTGAPATGVRFVLYQVNPDTREPVVPLVETGVSDLIDEDRAAANQVGLHLVVRSPTATLLDYRFGISGSIGQATFTVAGFMSDGTDQVNFDLTAASQLFATEPPVTLDATIAVPSQHFSVTVKLRLDGGTSQHAVADLTATAGADQVTVHADLSPTSIDASITVNGQLFATATGDPKSPTIRGALGRELTADELAALGAIASFADGVLKLVGGLLEPIGYLLLLGLGLGA